MTTKVRLAIDFGTSHTVAVLDSGTGHGQPLLFGESPLLPSAVCATGAGQILTGRDAVRSARMAPECFEPNPKRRIDDGAVLLGSHEYPVETLIGAVLKTVATEANRVAGVPPQAVAMTHPANWGSARLDVLLRAAAEAGLGRVRLVPEPEAAAVFFTSSQRSHRLPETVVVYDFGGGTFDVCALTLAEHRYLVRTQAGLDDVGGADLDAALLRHIDRVISSVDGETWRRIMRPVDPVTRRAFRSVYEDVKDAKEQLSRNSSALVHIPLLDRDFPVTREEFERVAGPLIERTVELTAATLPRSAAGQPVSVYLVGGSSRVPLVSTLLHRRLGSAPVITGQPEQVVAQGALRLLDEPVTDVPMTGEPVTDVPRHSPMATGSLPPVPAGPTPPSGHGRGKSRVWAFAAIAVVAVLAVLGSLYWIGSPGDSGGGKGDGASGDTAKDKSAEPVDVKVSKEPSIASFMDDDEEKNIGCYYADAADTGHPAECGDKNANRGFTRQVSDYEDCGSSPEEDDWRADGLESYCETVLVKKDACLDADFYTLVCDEKGAAYLITDGPKQSSGDCEGSKGVVQLKATEEYFCYDRNELCGRAAPKAANCGTRRPKVLSRRRRVGVIDVTAPAIGGGSCISR